MKTVLIVEDVELNIDLLVQLLEDDYHLLVARNGLESVAMAEQHNPELVLMDISLPGMDGYEATRAIRKTHPNLPVIGLSAHAMPGDTAKAIAAGCSDYLTKPLNEDLLFQMLDKYLG